MPPTTLAMLMMNPGWIEPCAAGTHLRHYAYGRHFSAMDVVECVFKAGEAYVVGVGAQHCLVIRYDIEYEHGSYRL